MGNGSRPAAGRGFVRGLLWGVLIAVALVAAVAGCSSEEAVTVPDLVGLEEAEAAEALTDAGLELGDVDYELVAASSERLNTVLSQDPSPGTEVEAGTAVAMVVAAGPSEASEDEDAETPPSGSGGGSGSNGGSGPGGGSGSGADLETKPELESGPELQTDPHWQKVSESSGTHNQTSGTFDLTSTKLRLTYVVASDSGGYFEFTLHRPGGPSVATLGSVYLSPGDPSRTGAFEKNVAGLTVPKWYKIRVELTPESGDWHENSQWSWQLLEWRDQGLQTAPEREF